MNGEGLAFEVVNYAEGVVRNGVDRELVSGEPGDARAFCGTRGGELTRRRVEAFQDLVRPSNRIGSRVALPPVERLCAAQFDDPAGVRPERGFSAASP